MRWLGLSLFLIATGAGRLAAKADLSQFHEATAGQYQVLAQGGQPIASDVNRFMNLMLDQYSRFFANWTQKHPARVVVYANAAEFRAALGSELGRIHAGLTGLCRVRTENGSPPFFELIAYQNDYLYRVLAHEGFHQFIAYELGEAPIWFNEGMAQYFETSYVVRGSLRVGTVSRPLLETAQAILRSEHGPTVQELIAMDQAAFYQRAEICYPLAWALAYYLMERDGTNYRSGSVKAYVQDLKRGHDPVKSFNQRFGRDTRQFQYDFAAFTLRLRARFD